MARPRKTKTFTPAERRRANSPAEDEGRGDLTPDMIEALAALEQINTPVDDILRSCREVGMTRGQSLALVERLAVRKAGYQHEFTRITTRSLITKIEEKIAMVMHYLDEFGIASATPKDLAVIFSLLVEKRQLLLGEPTQILSMQERKHINELIPELVKEAKNRGMTIDLDPGSYQEIGQEYKTARVIPPSDRTGERRPINRRMLARQAGDS